MEAGPAGGGWFEGGGVVGEERKSKADGAEEAGDAVDTGDDRKSNDEDGVEVAGATGAQLSSKNFSGSDDAAEGPTVRVTCLRAGGDAFEAETT